MKASDVVNITSEKDVIIARQRSRDILRTLGFGLADQTRLAMAISELTRNVIQHAGGGGGTCTITDESDHDQIMIRIVVEDHGPGIRDIDEAMRDGFSTGDGLGMGLPGARRLVHSFSIESKPGRTRIAVEMRQKRT